MSTILAMKLEKTQQLSVSSSEEIRQVVRDWTDEDNVRRRYLGGHVPIQAVVNGLIVWLLSRPPEEQRAIRDAGYDLLEQLEIGRLDLDAIRSPGDAKARRVVHGKPKKTSEDRKRKAN